MVAQHAARPPALLRSWRPRGRGPRCAQGVGLGRLVCRPYRALSLGAPFAALGFGVGLSVCIPFNSSGVLTGRPRHLPCAATCAGLRVGRLGRCQADATGFACCGMLAALCVLLLQIAVVDMVGGQEGSETWQRCEALLVLLTLPALNPTYSCLLHIRVHRGLLCCACRAAQTHPARTKRDRRGKCKGVAAQHHG